MLPLEQPDRIHVAFDDHRLVANAGLLLPVTLARHLGLASWWTAMLTWAALLAVPDVGDKMLTLAGVSIGRWRLHRRRRRAARWGTDRVLGCVIKAQVHAGDLPAEFPVGPRAPAGYG